MNARITDDWLPLPEALLNETGWRDGDTITIEVVGDTVLLTRSGSSAPERSGSPKGKIVLPAIPGHRHVIGPNGTPTCGCRYASHT